MYSKKINQLATNLNPQIDDLLPIGDAETGQLKTTTFGSVSGITGDGVISGGIVTWTGTGLNFNISACTYILNGVRYTSPLTTKTLAAADPTYDRIDVFAVNTSGQVEVIQGTPALNPVEPEGDTATTLGLTNVTIAAGATTPNNVSRDLIYDENVEAWTKSASVNPGSYNFADTAFAYTGTKSILITQGAGFTLLKFSKVTAMDISSYKSVSFAIRLNAAWTSNQILAVTFYNGTNQISNTYQLTRTNTVGFNRNTAAAWQLITIPLDGTLLKFKSNQFTEFRILTLNTATTYRLDTIQLNSGINNPGGGGTITNSFGFVNGSTGTASSTQATDTLNVVGTGLATTSATGKTLTIAVPSPIPSQTGNNGKYLTTDGNTLSWGTVSGMAIGGSITSATAGSVLFAGTSGILQQDNTNFFWDDTNNRLGIGTNTPTSDVQIVKGVNDAVAWEIKNTTTGTSAQSVMNFIADSNKTAQIQKLSTSFVGAVSPLLAGDFGITNFSSGDIAFVNNYSSGNIKFAAGGSSTSHFTIATTGASTFSGSITASSLIKSGGTSSQILAADGSVITAGTNITISGGTISSSGGSMAIGGSITSATQGSVLFAGASGVLAQDNSNFFWDDTNNRLGIGTSTPSNPLTISKNQNAATSILISNTTAATDSGVNTVFTSDTSAGSAGVGKYSSAKPTFKIISSSNAYIYNDTAGDIAILNDFATGRIKFAGGASSTAQMTLTSAGRLLIGTTTESTFILDVNGTARVSGKITANGSTSSTSGLDIGTLRFQHFATNNAFISENTFYNGTAFQRINTGLASVFYLSNGGFQVGTLTSAAGGTTQTLLNNRMQLSNDGKLQISDTITGGGTITHNESAVLQADSTTRGFLPPRMTTTQRNAIASPATGLMIYNTSLNTINYRNASAWVEILSSVLYDGLNIETGSTNGTKIGTATTQKLGFWNTTPVVQPDTSISPTAMTANSGTNINVSSTFAGYTVGQIVAALRQVGILA